MTILKIVTVFILLALGPVGWVLLLLMACCSKPAETVKVVYVYPSKSKNPFGFWGNTVIYK